MALAVSYSRANVGLDAPQVAVEVHLSAGLPGFSIVGLPETAVKESKDRVRSAILNSQFDFPDKRITVNLAPADLPKSGGRFDLAIALGILKASEQLKTESLSDWEFMAELALSGELRPVTGVLPGLIAAGASKRSSIVSLANADEAALCNAPDNRVAGHLLQVCAFLQGEGQLDYPGKAPEPSHCTKADFSDVAGQHQARRALLIAASGGHNLLLTGSPGTGKTMLASRFASLLPVLGTEQALETAAIQSLSGKASRTGSFYRPPFRSPHHTASAVAIVGGGPVLNPGEISLAHNGVLFLDELPEFSPKVLEVLREPLESGEITICRASYQITLPARFQLIAAMNPCPCGYYGDREKPCDCPPERVKRYQHRISGPLLDRIDLHVQVPRLSQAEQQELLQNSARKNESGQDLQQQVLQAQQLQQQRQGYLNARLDNKGVKQVCELNKENLKLLQTITEKMQLSMRACFRVLKVARTLADLDVSESVEKQHLLEAVGYRAK